MPFQVGGVSLHDDYQHTGSAARDVVDGVAGIGPGGNVLAPGPDLELTRDGSENIEIVERTSGNIVFRWTRVGVNDFECRVNCGGVACIIQNDSMKDVVNGIAALDAAGHLLVPGATAFFTRDGSENCYLHERTSSEMIVSWNRTGVDTWEGFMRESAAYVRIQTASMKDAVSGIAGLDANKLLDPVVYAVGLEEYSNHLGAVDDFTETGTGGNGTATHDAANHEMDLSTGVAALGYAYYGTKKSFTPGSKPIIVNIIVDNIADGTCVGCIAHIGLMNTLADPDSDHHATFRKLTGNTWQAHTKGTGGTENTNISTINNGDLCTIVHTASVVIFYVNGVVVATHSTQVASNALYLGAQVEAVGFAATVAKTVSIDFMSIKNYV